LERREVLAADYWSVFEPFDINQDGAISPVDVLNVVNAFNGTTGAASELADLNDDGVVDETDVDAAITALVAAGEFFSDPGGAGDYYGGGGPTGLGYAYPELRAVNYTDFDISADPYIRDAQGLKTFPTPVVHSGASTGGRSSYNRYFQWEDTNLDGSIDHTLDEVQLPVAIVRNTRANVHAKLFAGDPTKSYAPVMWVRAQSSLVLTSPMIFPPTLVMFDNADQHYTFVQQSSANVFTQVDHWQDYTLHFEAALPDTLEWQPVGTSTNEELVLNVWNHFQQRQVLSF